MSVSVCSNIPGFTEPVCFVSTGDDDEVVSKFVDYLENCQATAQQQMLHSFEDIFKQLKKFAEEEFVEQLFHDQLFAPPRVIKARDVKSLIE